ncbi:MAG: hypothetical protein ACI9KE_004308 [Polyangiales bacterium]|jgi:hypothetical protein
MSRCSLLLVLVACGGAPVQSAQVAPAVTVRANLTPPPPAPVCEFEGSWSGTLRFEDVALRVSSRTADARLFSSRLEAHVSGNGWHLRGYTNLGQDHVLRSQQAAWLGEGVAVDRGLHVSVSEAHEGRVLVSPHPLAIEHVVFTEPPGRWFGCEAVGLADQAHDETLEALQLPEVTETLRIDFPFSLTHVAGGAAFAEVRGNAFEQANPSQNVIARILERQGDWARIRVARYGGGSNVILVGWVEAGRLVGALGGGGVGIGGLGSSLHHEVCVTPRATLYIEGEGQRIEAGEVDAGTRLRVDQRHGEWARVRPLGEGLTLSYEHHFYVPSAGLECSPRSGTHLRETHRVQVNATGLTCGAQCECELQLTRPHQGRGRCQARLQCGAQVVFGDDSSNGYFACSVQEGRTTGADDEPSRASNGDPRFSLDGDVLTASDEAVGRLGVFRLEGGFIR